MQTLAKNLRCTADFKQHSMHMSISDGYQLAQIKEPAQGGKLAQPLLPVPLPRGLPVTLAWGHRCLGCRCICLPGSGKCRKPRLLCCFCPLRLCAIPSAIQTWLGRIGCDDFLISKLKDIKYRTSDASTGSFVALPAKTSLKTLTHLGFIKSRQLNESINDH